MENYKPFSCLGLLHPGVSESQLNLEDLTHHFYPGMALYIKNSANPVNSSLNFFSSLVCPGKKWFVLLYFSYNWEVGRRETGVGRRKPAKTGNRKPASGERKN